MATGQQWRALSSSDRLGHLLNHFFAPELLDEAAGLPAGTIKRIVNTLQQGKQSRILERPEVVEGLRRARRKMTDQTRSSIDAARKGEYTSPIIRTPYGVITPYKNRIYLGTAHKVVESYWTSYSVEWLSYQQIEDLAVQLYGVYLDTGQFNAFRFEYIATAEIYLSESTYQGSRYSVFRDAGLDIQHQTNKIIKLSSQTIDFPAARGNPNLFRELFRNDWYEKLTKGALRITDLVYTKFADVESVMDHVRSDYKRTKNKRRISNKGNRGNKQRKSSR